MDPWAQETISGNAYVQGLMRDLSLRIGVGLLLVLLVVLVRMIL